MLFLEYFSLFTIVNCYCFVQTEDAPAFWSKACTDSEIAQLHPNWKDKYIMKDVIELMLQKNIADGITGKKYGYIFTDCCSESTIRRNEGIILKGKYILDSSYTIRKLYCSERKIRASSLISSAANECLKF